MTGSTFSTFTGVELILWFDVALELVCNFLTIVSEYLIKVVASVADDDDGDGAIGNAVFVCVATGLRAGELSFK